MIKRAFAVVGVAVAAVLVPTVPAFARTGYFGDTLLPGQVLHWGNSLDEIHSSGRKFTLYMQPEGMDLDENGRGLGVTTWTRNGAYRGPEDKTHLTMQADGNLVLRHGNGDLIWQTHTRGKGNRLRILTTGNLVVRTPSGRTLWQSRTTPIILDRGQSLRSGGQFVYRSAPLAPTVRLVMHTNGDLVLSTNGRIRWHSNTHSPGSVATMTKAGGLAIVGPHGVVQWHTPSFGVYGDMHITQDGRIVVKSVRKNSCWQRPAPTPGNDCDSV